MNPADYAGWAGVPIVIALVAAVRSGTSLDKRWTPLLSIISGIAWQTGLAVVQHQERDVAVLMGVLTGLLASGLWSSTKAVVGK